MNKNFKKYLISCIAGGAIMGLVLMFFGYGLTTWQFWFVMIISSFFWTWIMNEAWSE